MIYTLTPNPSLDYIVSLDEFIVGATNRCSKEKIVAGGKGINVSIMLQNLGIKSQVLGFLAGFSGEEILRQLHLRGLSCDFVFLEQGQSRINLKIHTLNQESEINASGAIVGENDLKKLIAKLELLEDGDILILSGSLAKGLKVEFYAEILERLKCKNILSVIDACGDVLKNTLPYKPFLIKPNLKELEEFFGVSIDKENIQRYAFELQRMGARNVLVSLGGEGAMMVGEDGIIRSQKAPKGELKNSVGAGDSMVAGFMAGWLNEKDLDIAFQMSLACGSASAFSLDFASGEEVLRIFQTLKEK